MVTLHLCTILPALDPVSDVPFANRSSCDSPEAARSIIARCGPRGEGPHINFPESFRRVLKELTGMDLDADGCCAVAKDGTRHRLTDLPDDVCAALGVIVSAAVYDHGKVFSLFKELESLRILRALHALPEKFTFAVTLEAYTRISKAVDEAVAARTEAAPKNTRSDAWADALGEYGFKIEGSDARFYPRPDAPDVLQMEEPWFYNPHLLRKALLERRNLLTPLLHPVQEIHLGTVDGVPVTGHLLFNPDELLPVHTSFRYRSRYGLFAIRNYGGKSIFTDSGETNRDGVLGACRVALSLAKEKEGGTAVCLVTDGRRSLDAVIFCITATSHSIRVSDYRAAWEDFIAAVEEYLI